MSRHTNSLLQDKTPKEKINIINSDQKHIGNLRCVVNFIEKYKNDFEDWGLNNIKERSELLAEKAYIDVWNY